MATFNYTFPFLVDWDDVTEFEVFIAVEGTWSPGKAPDYSSWDSDLDYYGYPGEVDFEVVSITSEDAPEVSKEDWIMRMDEEKLYAEVYDLAKREFEDDA